MKKSGYFISIWNKTIGSKFNYLIIRNCNDRFCIVRFWIDPNKPTWEKVL